MTKLRLWRLHTGRTIAQVAQDTRLPAYIVSALDTGEVRPSLRWRGRFAEAYGAASSDFFEKADVLTALGAAIVETIPAAAQESRRVAAS